MFPRKQPFATFTATMFEVDVSGLKRFELKSFTASITKIPWSFSAGQPYCQKDFQFPAEVSSEAFVGEARVWKAMSLSGDCTHRTELSTFAGNFFPS